MLDLRVIGSLGYRDVLLPELELHEGGGIEGFQIRDGDQYAVSTDAMEDLCRYIEAPFGFVRKLADGNKGHVVAYLQQQLASAFATRPVTMVTCPTSTLVEGSAPGSGTTIVSFTDQELLHYPGPDLVAIDRLLAEAAAGSPLELRARAQDGPDVEYQLVYRVPQEIAGESWRWGYRLEISAAGHHEPRWSTMLVRGGCGSQIFLTAKQYRVPLPGGPTVEDRWSTIAQLIAGPPTTEWRFIGNQIERLQQAASVAEVKLVRSKLRRGLMVDKDDRETGDRIDQACRWRDIDQKYDFKNMPFKPTSRWFQRASTPVPVIDLVLLTAREATHAPNTVDPKKRRDLLGLAGKLLIGVPDLVDLPPDMTWP
jgi:hypothetical protein